MIGLCGHLLAFIWMFLTNNATDAFAFRGVHNGNVKATMNKLSIEGTSPLGLPEHAERLVGSNTNKIITKFGGVHRSLSAPTACQYVIANPERFLKEPTLLSQFDIKLGDQSEDNLMEYLARTLPVLYIADKHLEYGTLGFVLNRKSARVTMNDLYPNFRHLRHRPVYEGGSPNSGSSFTMIHSKVGFPENRAWKGVPSKPDFRLFFSPDVAMANELCSTRDADPSDFKFFQWATVWAPGQLEAQCQRDCWITLDGPVELLFGDDDPLDPLYRRILASMPAKSWLSHPAHSNK